MKTILVVVSVAAFVALAAWFAFCSASPFLQVFGAGMALAIALGIPFALTGNLPDSAYESSITQG